MLRLWTIVSIAHSLRFHEMSHGLTVEMWPSTYTDISHKQNVHAMEIVVMVTSHGNVIGAAPIIWLIAYSLCFIFCCKFYIIHLVKTNQTVGGGDPIATFTIPSNLINEKAKSKFPKTFCPILKRPFPSRAFQCWDFFTGALFLSTISVDFGTI